MLPQNKPATVKKNILVALIGNPNCGKTSVFNALTGSNQHVGNWPGVTIERKEGEFFYKEYTIQFIDLPGTYSLSPYTPEESITRNFLLKEHPDIVLNIIDTTNIERNLYLTTQILELGIPMIAVCNMFDEAQVKGVKMKKELLSTLLGTPIITTIAPKKEGIPELIDTIAALHEERIRCNPEKLCYDDELEIAIASLEEELNKDQHLAMEYPKAKRITRWIATKLLEGDDDAYRMVHDRIALVGLPACVAKNTAFLTEHFEKKPEIVIAEQRYGFAHGAVHEAMSIPIYAGESPTEKIDSIVLHRLWGIPLFLLCMWCVFQLTFVLGEIPAQGIQKLFYVLGRAVMHLISPGILQSVIVDGIIAGVGGVVVFLPYILLLFLAISFMEQSGYMSRVAFLMDRFMHAIGLHGKSFIPMILGFGCSVPAFMACRTLKNKTDRLVTMLVIPFLSCGAKLPVYALLFGAFFSARAAGNLLFCIYLFGMVIALIMARLLKSTVFRGETEPFVMELPPYRMPTIINSLRHMWERAMLYLRKAGTIILVASIAMWFLLHFPSSKPQQVPLSVMQHEQVNKSESKREAETEHDVLKKQKKQYDIVNSYAGRFGKAIEPIIAPLGFDWRIGISLIAGFSAKEVIIATMGTIMSSEKESDITMLKDVLKKDKKWNPVVALALAVFVLLYVPCLSATIVFLRETFSFRWTGFMIVYTILVAYGAAFLVYRIGNYITTMHF